MILLIDSYFLAHYAPLLSLAYNCLANTPDGELTPQLQLQIQQSTCHGL
jgi:hypothetical protein